MCAKNLAVYLFIAQDFSLMFGDDISATFLDKWPPFYRPFLWKLISVMYLWIFLYFSGWDCEISYLAHDPPSPQGRTRPGKLSARQAIDQNGEVHQGMVIVKKAHCPLTDLQPLAWDGLIWTRFLLLHLAQYQFHSEDSPLPIPF